LAIFNILLTIIKHCPVANKRIKKCLSIAMKIGQGEGSDVRVIHIMHNQLHKLLTHRKRGKEGGYKVPANNETEFNWRPLLIG